LQILSVTASALNFLRENIIMGNLKPGDKLNECDISNSISISRPPLREAFRLLENEYLVVNIPRRGTYVNEMSVKDFTDISQIREMIECYAVDILKSAGIYDLTKVTQALENSSALPAVTNPGNPLLILERVEVLLSFHKTLVESAGNLHLIRLYQSFRANLARYQFLYFQVTGTEQHSLEDHQHILDLISTKEYEKAKKQLKQHIDYTREIINTALVTNVLKGQK
jgi:DNA-binding GntR family transcriptional regulator